MATVDHSAAAIQRSTEDAALTFQQHKTQVTQHCSEIRGEMWGTLRNFCVQLLSPRNANLSTDVIVATSVKRIALTHIKDKRVCYVSSAEIKFPEALSRPPKLDGTKSKQTKQDTSKERKAQMEPGDAWEPK